MEHLQFFGYYSCDGMGTYQWVELDIYVDYATLRSEVRCFKTALNASGTNPAFNRIVGVKPSTRCFTLLDRYQEDAAGAKIWDPYNSQEPNYCLGDHLLLYRLLPNDWYLAVQRYATAIGWTNDRALTYFQTPCRTAQIWYILAGGTIVNAPGIESGTAAAVSYDIDYDKVLWRMERGSMEYRKPWWTDPVDYSIQEEEEDLTTVSEIKPLNLSPSIGRTPKGIQWFPGAFQRTPGFHMVFWDGNSFYIPNNFEINERVQYRAERHKKGNAYIWIKPSVPGIIGLTLQNTYYIAKERIVAYASEYDARHRIGDYAEEYNGRVWVGDPPFAMPSRVPLEQSDINTVLGPGYPSRPNQVVEVMSAEHGRNMAEDAQEFVNAAFVGGAIERLF